RELLNEPVHRLRTNRLRAIQGGAPRTQVEAFEGTVWDFAHAQFVSKIRRRTERATMLVNRSQPALGAAEECQRRKQHQRNSGDEGDKPGANQSHIVVERE